MIVEERAYVLRPGAVPDYLDRYERRGMAIQVRILGRPLGYFSTDTGPLNEVVHLWVYDDYADRARRRAELAADDGWQAYLRDVLPLVESQRSRIMVPAPFMAGPLREWAAGRR